MSWREKKDDVPPTNVIYFPVYTVQNYNTSAHDIPTHKTVLGRVSVGGISHSSHGSLYYCIPIPSSSSSMPDCRAVGVSDERLGDL